MSTPIWICGRTLSDPDSVAYALTDEGNPMPIAQVFREPSGKWRWVIEGWLNGLEPTADHAMQAAVAELPHYEEMLASKLGIAVEQLRDLGKKSAPR